MFRYTLAIFLAALFFAAPTSAQKISTAFLINYEVEYLDSENSDMLDMMGKTTMQFVFKGQKSMVKTDNALMKMSVMMDDGNKKGLLLMSMMGINWAAPVESDDFEETIKDVQKLDPVVQYLNGRKNIAGYKCSKAIVTNADEVTEVWYTKKLKPLTKGMEGSAKYAQLDGFPLVMKTIQGDIKMVLTATKVQTKNIEDKLFSMEIPDGFEIKTLEEINSQ